MKRMISTVGLSRADWLCTRRQGITGTDAGAITGMNPYVSAFQVYQDKLSTDVQETDNEAMRQGRDLEEYVASVLWRPPVSKYAGPTPSSRTRHTPSCWPISTG